MKQYLKKVGALLALLLAVIGFFGGVGYICAWAQTEAGEWSDVVVPIVGLLVLVVLAWPQILKLWKILNDACEL